MKMKVLQALEANDGKCLDSPEERVSVALAVVGALEAGGMTLKAFGEALDKISDNVDIDTFNDFVVVFVEEICRIRGWTIEEAYEAAGVETITKAPQIPEISLDAEEVVR